MPGHTGYYSDLSEFVNTDQILDQVELYRDQALASEEAAEAAQSASEMAASDSAASAAAASASAGNSAASASTASTQATAALASALAADTARAAAVTAQGAAATSASNAASSAAAAAASAAGVNLPSAAGNALNMLRQNSGETGLEYRTPTQVRSDLSLANTATITGTTANTANTVVIRDSGGGVTGASISAGSGAVTGGSLNVGGGSVSCGSVNAASGAISGGAISGSTITASTGFSGPGSSITALNMANAGSGTLAVARGGTGVTSSTGTGNVVLSASPTLTGTPLAPTAAVSTNTTQIATTAFVRGEVAPAEARLAVLEAVFTKKYISAQQTFSNGGGLSITHSLGVSPDVAFAYVVCITAEWGFTAGQKIPITTFMDASAASYGLSVEISGTSTAVIRIASGGLDITHASTGVGQVLTPANWRLVVGFLK